MTRGISARAVHGSDSEIAHRAARADEYLEGWRRARADYENLHRRSTEERDVARQAGIHQTLLSLVPVMDHFDAAFAHVPEELAAHPWVHGVRNIQQAFVQALATEGIEVLDVRNAPFDPALHEAVATVESDLPEGVVVDTVARGYVSSGSVLRPAKVRVSSGARREKSVTPVAAVASQGGSPETPTSKTSSPEVLGAAGA